MERLKKSKTEKSQSRSIIEKLYFPINPLIVLVPPIYAITRLGEFLGLVKENFWTRSYLWLIDYHLPGKMFTRDNLVEKIMYQFPYETAKGFWIIGLGFFIVSKAKFFEKFKVQNSEQTIPTGTKLYKMLFLFIVNQYVVGPIFLRSVLFVIENCMTYAVPDDAKHIPTFTRFMFEICVNCLIFEILFYYLHRLLHTKYLYKYIHKIHHEYNTPFSMISIYCHPIEMYFLNFWALLVGFLLIHGSLPTAFVWIVVHGFTTMVDHSGYQVPFFNSPYFHDHHHEKFTGNYGAFGWMDYLHGTDTSFRNSENFKKHKVFVPFYSTLVLTEKNQN